MGKDVRNGIKETDKGMGEWREEGEQWTWDTIGLERDGQGEWIRDNGDIGEWKGWDTGNG